MTTQDHISVMSQAPSLGALRSFYTRACLDLVQDLASGTCLDGQAQAQALRKAARKRRSKLRIQLYRELQQNSPF